MTRDDRWARQTEKVAEAEEGAQAGEGQGQRQRQRQSPHFEGGWRHNLILEADEERTFKYQKLTKFLGINWL